MILFCRNSGWHLLSHLLSHPRLLLNLMKTQQNISIGIDVGCISINVSLLGDKSLEKQKFSKEYFCIENQTSYSILALEYTRIKGNPINATIDIIKKIKKDFKDYEIGNIVMTGSGGKFIAKELGLEFVNEFKSIVKGTTYIFKDVKTIFEIGGESSKYIRIKKNTKDGSTNIIDYQTSGDCAAGTGSFLDQQATRLKYKIEEVGDIASASTRSAPIAGRCSVFAKSDMIHAQQKGFQPRDVLAGLCNAVVKNFKGTILKGKKVEPKVLFLGGVSQNKAIIKSLKKILNLEDDELIVPSFSYSVSAIGAAFLASESESITTSNLELPSLKKQNFPKQNKLSMDNVVLLKDKINKYNFSKEKVPVYLGVDVGSVSTNLVVIDTEGNLIYEIYTQTKGRPIEVVADSLLEIKNSIGDKIEIKGVGTTGSGRELIGELIGADIVKDEITAHKTGAIFVDKMLVGEGVDTIFEIGGQDSKFISIENGVVVDFTMNEACAAGTGSFLEEQAEKLHINIKDEFARLALSSEAPIKLGERCTVFMEQDINAYLKNGANVKDLLAGLSYSIALNYLNRVVGNRKVGDKIYFQGGTAYNNAVAAAFGNILNKKIIVPPHNGVIGAYGVALLAKEAVTTEKQTGFRGYEVKNIQYNIKEFTCKACTNTCNIQEFNVEGSKTYWGDKCSTKYRKKTKTELKPIVSNLIDDREELLMEVYENLKDKGSGPTIGFPRAMYFFDNFAFWSRFFSSLDFKIVLSDKTDKKIMDDGISLTVSEPCFPIRVAHGHVNNLINKNTDYIFLPNIINTEPNKENLNSHLCVWGQTLPYVIKNNSKFAKFENKFISPTLYFSYGQEHLSRTIKKYFKKNFKIKEKHIEKALEQAFASESFYNNKKTFIGTKVLNRLIAKKREGIILIGRPYNVCDPGLNINVPYKLLEHYGVNVIPMDMINLPPTNIDDINDNMFWSYGYKIIQTVKYISKFPNFHIIYVTNFKCGPDSYVKQFATAASDKPFLTLQFDEHSNDAGIITRCEAYLDSKGVLGTKAKAA